MIEDKKNKIVMPEDINEKMWVEVVEKTESDIENLNKLMVFNNAVLEMAKSKIKSKQSAKNEKNREHYN
jgi:cytochrome b involved in lipid metabolism